MGQQVVISETMIEQKIFLIRGKKVMVDRDLAGLYGVETKYLNRQVKRNKERFLEEFMFQLTLSEKNELVTNWHQFESMKYSSVLPYVFTEHGVAMLASVLNSDAAVKISIAIIKIFVKLRELLSTHKNIVYKLVELERKVGKHDENIKAIFEAIRKLMAPSPLKPKPQIGFKPDPDWSKP